MGRIKCQRKNEFCELLVWVKDIFDDWNKTSKDNDFLFRHTDEMVTDIGNETPPGLKRKVLNCGKIVYTCKRCERSFTSPPPPEKN